MNCRKNLLRSSVGLFLFVSLIRCGVKGDPVPPDKPTEIGRGRPTYRRATEGIRVKQTPVPKEDSDRDKDKDEDNDD